MGKKSSELGILVRAILFIFSCFGIDLPYSQFQFFNMKKTFGLDDCQYEELMKVGHQEIDRYEKLQKYNTLNPLILLGLRVIIYLFSCKSQVILSHFTT